MIKIILLGSNGFIGSHVQNLLKNYKNIISLDLPEFDILTFNVNNFRNSYIDDSSKTIMINWDFLAFCRILHLGGFGCMANTVFH